MFVRVARHIKHVSFLNRGIRAGSLVGKPPGTVRAFASGNGGSVKPSSLYLLMGGSTVLTGSLAYYVYGLPSSDQIVHANQRSPRPTALSEEAAVVVAIKADEARPEPAVEHNGEDGVPELAPEQDPSGLEERPFPDHVPYLLIGGGTASFAAYRAIKAKDPKAKILVVGQEQRLPYMRPPLTKELWYQPTTPKRQGEGEPHRAATQVVDPEELRFHQWNGRERSLYYEPEQFYAPAEQLSSKANGGVSVVRGVRVLMVDPIKQVAHLDNGHKVRYDKCLIAIGGRPKNLPVFEKGSPALQEKVSTYRTVDDFFKLEETLRGAQSVVVVGGGFLGSELACALGNRAKIAEDKGVSFSVAQVYPEHGNMARVLPEYLSNWATDKLRAEGVKVLNNRRVEAAAVSASGQVNLALDDGTSLEADHVVVAVGIEPEPEFASRSGLEIDAVNSGYLVNAELEARTNVWVAGDAASFYDPILGRRRVEHHDHAVVSGRLAGENMTGSHKTYTHQSMFWSDLGPDVGYEAIGLVDSDLQTVGVFATARSRTDADNGQEKGTVDPDKGSESLASPAPPTLPDASSPGASAKDNYNKGVVFYLKNKVVVGILLWNVFGKMSVARRIIRDHREYDDLAEVAKLFKIHDQEVNSDEQQQQQQPEEQNQTKS